MSIFSNYDEIEDVDVTQESAQEDKVAKRLKKNNKLLKRLIKLEEQRVAEATQTKKSGFRKFFKKIGKVIVNAIPDILKTLISEVIRGIFKVKVAELKI